MQLHRRRSEFAAFQAQVLLVSFSPVEQARRWQSETQVDLPLLLDPQRTAYRAYGLRRSVWRVWQPKIVWRYARMMLEGWRLRGIQDDPHQLGGDFVVDAGGIMRFAHRSADPADRPSVEALLEVIASLLVTVNKSGSS